MDNRNYNQSIGQYNNSNVAKRKVFTEDGEEIETVIASSNKKQRSEDQSSEKQWNQSNNYNSRGFSKNYSNYNNNYNKLTLHEEAAQYLEQVLTRKGSIRVRTFLSLILKWNYTRIRLNNEYIDSIFGELR